MASDSDAAGQQDGRQPRRAVFRLPTTAVLGALLVMVAATPIAWTIPGMQALYLLPLAVIVWVLRRRTVADADGLEVRTVLHTRRIAWGALHGLSFSGRSGASAVLADGSTIPLPTVRARHLPVLAAVSDGRVTDPTLPRDEAGGAES